MCLKISQKLHYAPPALFREAPTVTPPPPSTSAGLPQWAVDNPGSAKGLPLRNRKTMESRGETTE